jgi:hypothetical protein
MVHGPCGAANPKAPCMRDGICTKQYPKEFCEETTFDEHSYPKYRRPNNGRIHVIGKTSAFDGYHVDNRWIVPYNPYFSAACVIFFTVFLH